MRGRVLGVLLALSVVLCGWLAVQEFSSRPATSSVTQTPPVAHYVGSAKCAECHQAQTAAWRESHHAKAMQPATAQTVLGRFDNTRFKENGVVSTFFRKEGRYFVRTDGPDGKLNDFEVKYTFGIYPLQQYLVPFPDGRMQALPIAWDARPARQGGQRWFHLYAGQHVNYRDPLHWTRLNQNWNYMCAECHTTNLQRNYDAKKDQYATTWTDINVGCESCHGAGSNHLAWARHQPGTDRLPHKGLEIALDERKGVHWIHDALSGNSSRSTALVTHREVETCAVCHSRRSPLGTERAPTGRLLDTHDPALLQANLYFPDGQQQDEVYIYGSFLQSKMYAKGVTCSDCHDPHTAKLRAEGNALCAQCHAPAKYDVPAHHHHTQGSAGSQCVNCHMPARTYMGVDPRRDHSIRIPRPDLSVQYGVPNACNSCHKDRDAQWAESILEKEHGSAYKGYQHYVDALASAREGSPGAAHKLLDLAGDKSSPAIARATAINALSAYPGVASLKAIRAALMDPNPLLRSAGLEALLVFPPQVRAQLALPLVNDQVRVVRIKAGRALASIPDNLLTADQRVSRDQAFALYRQSQNDLADRPESHVNLGSVYTERGESQKAIEEYQAALKLDPLFVPAYVNLSDLYRSLGQEDQVISILAKGLEQIPQSAALLYLSGLQRVRAGKSIEALSLLKKAAEASPDDAHYAYAYAVALNDSGNLQEAIRVITKGLQRSKYSPELLQAATAFERQAGNLESAQNYRQRYTAVMSDANGR